MRRNSGGASRTNKNSNGVAHSSVTSSAGGWSVSDAASTSSTQLTGSWALTIIAAFWSLSPTAIAGVGLVVFFSFRRLIFSVTVATALFKVVSILNRWRIYIMESDDLTQALHGLKYLIGRGRKETELLLNGDYGRRVAVGYVFKDLARFADGQSYLNMYLRSRTKIATERLLAEWEDRRPKRPVDGGGGGGGGG